MARSVEQELAALRTVEPGTAAGLEQLRKAVQLRRAGAGIVVERAAKLVRQHRLDALVPDLIAAFDWLLVDGVKRDPQCRGKLAVARALHELDHWDDRVFAVGLRVVQLEGWDTPDDMAAELRGICGLAHAHFGRADALDVLAGLLADPERTTQVAAAQGLGDAGRPDASALLRYKVLAGDADPDVVAACFASLFSLAREASIPFAIELLARDDERAEAAALALGDARATEAFDALVAWSDRCAPEERHRVGYLALALLRSEAATAYLLDTVTTADGADAAAAARALATFKDDPAITERLRAAIAAATDPAARRELAGLLGD